jgi:LytS/YehU family sensor histidine kinase
VEFVWQILYYALLILVMLIILNWQTASGVMTRWAYVRRIILALLLTIIGIYFAPIVAMKDGVMRIVFFFESDPRNHAYLIVITKGLFIFMLSVLYSRIYLLMRQRQSMVVENERLKNDYLTTRYNMLVGQINPHFFFNSLNSLAMLVREKDDKRALEYIDQLSYTFRYIIQNGQNGLTTLKDEMAFAEAYIYLFKIRYEDKLFFNIDIDPKYMGWTLPALSLQPLIGNAVKHNSITTKKPLYVTIRVVDGILEVENPKHLKLDVEQSTGIGLENLRSRWSIVSGRSIEIIDEESRFLVRLPLVEPKP